MPELVTLCAVVQEGEACPMGQSPRERALAVALLQLGVREDAGPNRDHAGRIAGYLAPCVRGGERLGLTAAPWCAAFVSWCVWQAFGALAMDRDPEVLLMVPDGWVPALHAKGDPPIGYRASVAELCVDARATSALRLPTEHLLPDLGDVLIFGRDGGDPLRGGLGHCGFAHAIGGDWIDVLAGNQLDAVTIARRPLSDVLAWIDLGGP